MSSEQKYFHDRTILLLITISVFLVILSALLILVKSDGSTNEGYIIQYRSNLLVSPFKAGGLSKIMEFIPFNLIVFGVSVFLSYRMHSINRRYASIFLALGGLILFLSLVVSNALLAL